MRGVPHRRLGRGVARLPPVRPGPPGRRRRGDARGAGVAGGAGTGGAGARAGAGTCCVDGGTARSDPAGPAHTRRPRGSVGRRPGGGRGRGGDRYCAAGATGRRPRRDGAGARCGRPGTAGPPHTHRTRREVAAGPPPREGMEHDADLSERSPVGGRGPVRGVRGTAVTRDGAWADDGRGGVSAVRYAARGAGRVLRGVPPRLPGRRPAAGRVRADHLTG
ncbi:exported protein of unknown function [Streptantibioticus cattleyicolor NRRL 8057 = DSM 46488]|nr:exported protein of unknown function [Streptantibioticus cattleyicolor NRRL 8057 = DSM 46488]